MEGILKPLLFTLKQNPAHGIRSARQLGRPRLLRGGIPMPAVTLTIAGVTKDETGSAAGGFTVYLFDMTSGSPVLAQTTLSDGAGLYSFSVGRGGYWAVDYKVGTPDKAGASVWPLAGL